MVKGGKDFRSQYRTVFLLQLWDGCFGCEFVVKKEGGKMGECGFSVHIFDRGVRSSLLSPLSLACCGNLRGERVGRGRVVVMEESCCNLKKGKGDDETTTQRDEKASRDSRFFQP